LARDHARTREMFCSAVPKLASKALACSCQTLSLVSGTSGESAAGGMPAMKRATSFGDGASAARTGAAATSNRLAAAAISVLR
jgi:hypothetical protein